MSSILWEFTKKASIAGLVVFSIPVLVPSAFVLAFAGAVLAVPIGSAAVGFVLLKKILGKNYLEWPSGSSSPRLESARDDAEVEKEMLEKKDEHDPAGASSSSSSSQSQAPTYGEIACEEAPEVKASEDYIVVEKPLGSHSLVEFEQHGEEIEEDRGDKLKKAQLQCKSAPDFFQCVEAEIADKEIGAADTRADDDGGRDKEDGAKLCDEKDKDACANNNKHQGVGLSVILEETDKKPSLESLEEGSGAKNKKNVAAPDSGEETHHLVENGDFGIVEDGHDHGKEEPRSSVDEYVSMTEDFPETTAASSDESVTSAGKSAASAAASAAKPEVPEKEKRARLRKEIAALKKVIGYKDSVGGSLATQVERLYIFLGVELPSGCSGSSNDYGKLLEAMNSLKAVVGVQ